jgi:uncharacterized OB-fold protein
MMSTDTQYPVFMTRLHMENEGELWLQQCNICHVVNYPYREVCKECLADALELKHLDGEGELLSITTLHHSNEEHFQKYLPLQIGSVQLKCGPIVIAFLMEDVSTIGQTVEVGIIEDNHKHRFLFACDQNTSLKNSDGFDKLKSLSPFLSENN